MSNAVQSFIDELAPDLQEAVAMESDSLFSTDSTMMNIVCGGVNCKPHEF